MTAARWAGRDRSRLVEYDRQSRRAEEPILSECSETERRQNWRGRAALSWLCLPSTMAGSEQTGFPLVWHPFISALPTGQEQML